VNAEAAPRVLAFDVNETLLDLSALDGLFEEFFGTAEVRREWFALAVHAALVTTVTRRYESFADIAAACFESLAGRSARPLAPADRERRSASASTGGPPHRKGRPMTERSEGIESAVLLVSPPTKEGT
jgi:2-haloacid dehalogenase